VNNRPVVQTYLKVYTCPSDINGNRILQPATTADDGGGPYMTGSYRGMSGRTCQPGNQWAGYYTEIQSLIAACPGFRGLLHTDGIAIGTATAATTLKPERIASVTDGTSNTLMIGERTTRTQMDSGSARGTFWGDSFNLYSLSGAFTESVTLLNDYVACVARATDQAECKYGWGSFHPSGINFVFCDGSVRTIPVTINMDVFVALSTIAGGETIPSDF
jgi:prepilin-type processing-associated H-X9-DG protein